jgi:ATP-dependent Lhr-like helicase
MELLLDCYGVLARPIAMARHVPGGYSALTRRAELEEIAGTVRRGYFVDGLGGNQFALPEVVDRLRAIRDVDPTAAHTPVILRVDDPAQPYGAIVPWPSRRDGAPLGRVAPGSRVILVGGRPLAVFATSGHTLTRLEDPDELPFANIAAALAQLVESGREQRVVLERVDDELVGGVGQMADALGAAGFERTHRGWQYVADPTASRSFHSQSARQRPWHGTHNWRGPRRPER